MKVLVINSGSSSIKYQVFTMEDCAVATSGVLERIGTAGSRLRHRWREGGREREAEISQPVSGHREGLQRIVTAMSETGVLRDAGELFGIGHRVVHGGEKFREPALIDNAVLADMRSVAPLAPLHNPANLAGIEVARSLFPEVAQVAVFDTAFHHSIPPHAFHYALPYDLYTGHQVRRYGFHGTSYQYVTKQAAAQLGRPLETLNLIAFHLGNGASGAAIRAGNSIDTSMGMTPLEGLMMGTRCGDLDPAVHFYLAKVAQLSNDDLEDLLNRASGLKGICGASDMREVERRAQAGDARARLAIDLFCYRVRKYIGAYTAVLGRVDALVFTGGIGENAPAIRQRCCEGLEGMGIMLDEGANRKSPDPVNEIQHQASAVKVLVIRTNEELEIARQTVDCIQANRRAS